MSDSMDITALSPETLSKILSVSYRRRISESQVREIAERGNLISSDGTIHLLRYAAYLAGGASDGNRHTITETCGTDPDTEHSGTRSGSE